MAVHFVDLYNFMNCLGPSIMCIGVFNVGRVHSLFLELYKFEPWLGSSTLWTYKFDPGWVRPLCGLISLTLVGSVHFVDRVDP